MFTGIYMVFAVKSECRDFRIAGFTCMSAFSINSVGVLFMEFAGKLSYMGCTELHAYLIDKPYKTAIMIKTKICNV